MWPAARECEKPPRLVGAFFAGWSGRRDSNPRMVAWEATALPLGDARLSANDYSRMPVACQGKRGLAGWMQIVPEAIMRALVKNGEWGVAGEGQVRMGGYRSAHPLTRRPACPLIRHLLTANC